MPYIIPRIDPHNIESKDVSEKVLALDITDSVERYIKESQNQNQYQALTIGHIMAFTQAAWKLNPEHASDMEYVFAYCKTPDGSRQIIGVFELYRRGDVKDSARFFQSAVDAEGRMIFLAIPADEAIWNKYVGLMLKPAKQGEANPVRYYEQ